MAEHNHSQSDTLPVQSRAPAYTLSDILGAPYSKKNALDLLQTDSVSYKTYLGFELEHQKKLLSLLMGRQGLSITYDNFFKHVMNPEIHPKRLESFLSSILEQQVKIRQVLPLEGNKLSSTGGTVILDILVELADGTLVNVEIQKIGNRFPGERSCCYAADMLMRQFNRVKDEKGAGFTFQDLKPVCLIVIMEDSSAEFKAVAPAYLHRQQISYDSGAEIPYLFKIIYISLDTFHSVVHNISNQLEAWLTFLSSDDPEEIVQLVNTFPEFLACYQDIVKFRTNPRELITMYSEALMILERNTTKFMVEEMRAQIKQLEQVKQQTEQALHQQEQALHQQEQALHQQEQELLQKEQEIQRLKAEIQHLRH